MSEEMGNEEPGLTLAQLREELTQFSSDVDDLEVLLQDEYGRTSSIAEVAEANGPFIITSTPFEEEPFEPEELPENEYVVISQVGEFHNIKAQGFSVTHDGDLEIMNDGEVTAYFPKGWQMIQKVES